MVFQTHYFLFSGTAEPGKLRLMPAVVLWMSAGVCKPTCWGCSPLLMDSGEERKGRCSAGGCWGLLDQVFFPLAVVFQLSDEAPELTPLGGHSQRLKDGGGEGEDGTQGGCGLLDRSRFPQAAVVGLLDNSPRPRPRGGCSHLLRGGGEEGKGSGEAWGDLGRPGLSCWGGHCRPLRDGGEEGEGRGGA